jgi:hypothetical protein
VQESRYVQQTRSQAGAQEVVQADGQQLVVEQAGGQQVS